VGVGSNAFCPTTSSHPAMLYHDLHPSTQGGVGPPVVATLQKIVSRAKLISKNWQVFPKD